MKKFFCRWFLFLMMSVFYIENMTAQNKMFSWDFSDVDVRDILFAVSLDTGISIVADDTVSGSGSFKFAGSDFNDAFDSFLRSSRLYVSKKENLWTVSKMSVEHHDDLFSLDVYDLMPNQIFEKLEEVLPSVITYESLPGFTMTMHFKDLTEKELIENVVKHFGSYDVIRTEKGYHIEKKSALNVQRNSESQSGYCVVRLNDDGTVFVDVNDTKASEVLNSMFELKINDEMQFCFLVNSDVKVNRCCFTGKNFDETVSKFCSQNGMAVVVSDDVYYVIQDADSRNKLIFDKKNWSKFSLNFVKAEKVVNILGKILGKVDAIILPDGFSFLCKITEAEKVEIDELISEVDEKTQTYLIELKYIKPEEFVRYLPPCVEKENVFFADDSACVYFNGTEKSYLNLCEQIKLCDKPVKRISYDLLILQYDESSENSWTTNFGFKNLSYGDRNKVAVQLGSVLNLNFNVITALGLDFAASLQTSIGKNTTKVFADTTLYGISGKQINFQNTNTYRYRDNNLDPDTGKPVYSGVTREIVSGLKIDVTGWVSGDGMITSSVTASITRQGTDLSSSTGNPPATTEKIVTTEVCGKSGEPVVLSGLLQDSVSDSDSGAPSFAKIILSGSSEKINQKSQMIIYLIPHVQDYDEDENLKTSDFEWGKNRIRNLLKFL